MRKYAALILGMLFAGSAVASDVTYTTLTVAYGKVRRKDGTYADLKGLKVPARIERVKTARRNPPPTPSFRPAISSAPAPLSAAVLTNIYWADQDPNNSGSLPYGEIDPEFVSCSVLDDIQINANGVNAPWQQLTWGMDNPAPHDFLIRWTIWNSYNASAPNGTSAFQPYPVPPTYMLDFGVKWPVTQTMTGPIKVTINIAAAQVAAPQTMFWFSQQFRIWQFGNPNAPFDTTVANLFNQSLPPQVGSSDVFYWLDLEGGPDGKYEEQEKDIFGETQNPLQGNLLLKIEGNTSGSLVDALPTAAVLEQGVFVSGDFSDLHFSDDFYYIAQPNYTLPRTVEPIQLRIDGRSPQANINSISFTVESSTVGGDATQKLQLYRFGGATPGWVDVNTRTINGVDSSFTYVYTGANPQHFVNPADQNRVRARVLVTPGAGAARSFVARIDRGRWAIGLP
jgi:hypothetical protein